MARLHLHRVACHGLTGGLLCLSAGCSSLNHYLVDANGAAGLHLETAAVYGQQPEFRTLRFDASGGRVIPDSSLIRGRTATGEDVTLPFPRVRHVTFKRVADDAGGTIKARIGPLQGDFERALSGRIRRVVQSDATVIDLRQVPCRVDLAAHALRWSPAPDQESEIPLSSIAYLQMKQGSSGRTALLVSGFVIMAGVVGVAIALSSWNGVGY